MNTIALDEEKLKILRAQWESFTATEQPSNEELKERMKVLDAMHKLESKITKENGKPKEKQAELKNLVAEFVHTYNIHFVATHKAWFYYAHGQWFSTGTDAFNERFRGYISGEDEYPMFQTILDAENRKLDNASFTWKTQPGYLNLMADHKLCAMAEDNAKPHYLFTLLLRSIGGDKSENVEHLERVILSKFLHPNNPELPALVFSDPGGTGKGLFGSFLCATIFGREAIADNLSMELAFGKFNNVIAGKLIAIVNEKEEDGGARLESGMQKIIGSQTFQCEGKYQHPMTADVSQLFIIEANPKNGFSIRLAHNNTDRRYSIIHGGPNTLNWYIADYHGFDHDDEEAVAYDWMHEGRGVAPLTDPIQVGIWLKYLYDKHGDVRQVRALHGADYAVQKVESADIVTRICEAIFVSDFKYVRGEVIYQLAVANGCTYKNIGFHRQVSLWLEKYRKDIVYGSIYWNDPPRNRARVYRVEGTTVQTPNDADYGVEEFGKWKFHIDIV